MVECYGERVSCRVQEGGCMIKGKEMSYENSIENARRFLENQDKRKSPNNRVNGSHFMDIANKGAERLKEKLAKE